MKTKPHIIFGTSGWRAIISDEFTFKNVAIVAEAIARYILSEKKGKGVVVGYDTRFSSDEFAEKAANVVADYGIPVYFTETNTPTPVIAFHIRKLNAAGGINITASHNPYEYNGIKFSPSYGGPALPNVTQRIENYIEEIRQQKTRFPRAAKKAEIHEFDPKPDYFQHIRHLINFDQIRKARLKIAGDLKYGTSRGYLDTLLEEAGCEVEVMHKTIDPLFGGRTSEPSEQNLSELISFVKNSDYNLGLSTDGDGDRFGIVDTDGTYITANLVIGLAVNHLYKHKNQKGNVARTVSTTHFIDDISKLYGGSTIETNVGFKYLGELLHTNKVFLAGEESGGLSISQHVPEKDGIYACLLMAEIVAVEGKPLKEIIKDIEKRIGREYHTDRIDFQIHSDKKTSLISKLQSSIPEEFSDYEVIEINDRDGFKFVFDDGNWVMFRMSGTEPVVRSYLETDSADKLNRLIDLAKQFLSRYV